jgi:NADH pyrophosphatase NudC (nudix superfamily)
VADFLDKLKKGLDKGITTVSVKSKEVLETTQLRNRLTTLQKEKREGFAELGSIVYTSYLQGRLEETLMQMQDKCKPLAVLDEKIRETEADIAKVHMKAQQALGDESTEGQGRCSCGAALRTDTKFCGGCGKPVDAPTDRVEAETQSLHCPQCTAPISPSSRFCGGCGAKIDVESGSSTSQAGRWV